MSRRSGWALNVVIVACAVSAGVHTALVPEHLAEGTAAGLAFLASAVVVGGLAAALTRRPSAAVLIGTSAVLAGLIGSYAAAITSGLPLLHPMPEAVEGLAVLTKAVEAVGLLAAAHLLRGDRSGVLLPVLPRPKGTLT
jgi:hypothetical protein